MGSDAHINDSSSKHLNKADDLEDSVKHRLQAPVEIMPEAIDGAKDRPGSVPNGGILEDINNMKVGRKKPFVP